MENYQTFLTQGNYDACLLVVKFLVIDPNNSKLLLKISPELKVYWLFV